MRRRLFTLCSALSLLLCAAVCVVWVRSYKLSDQFLWQRTRSGVWGRSAPGQIVFGRWLTNRADRPSPTDFRYTRDDVGWSGNWMVFLNGEPGDKDISWQRSGFAWYEKRQTSGCLYAQYVAPFWFVALVAGGLPLIWTATRWRSRLQERRRKNIGLCPACGYDLRASPDRCPECGRGVRSGVKELGGSII